MSEFNLNNFIKYSFLTIWLLLASANSLFSQGPGIGNLTYTDDELFRPIWIYEDETHYGSNVATMLNGYLVTTIAPDSGQPPGGILVFDVSDPRSPQLVKRIYDERTNSFRESHAFGNHENYIALQDICGIQIWDFTDPVNPIQVVKYCMDGYKNDDYGSAWQLFWQAPYIYVANGSSGYDIIDASDVSNPQKIKHVNIGMQVGPIFAVGNLLVTTAHDKGTGYAISDISDPLNPFVINSQRDGLQKIYAASFNGHKIISSARGNSRNSSFTVHEVKDPTNFELEMTFDIENTGEQLYNATQDNYVIQGCQSEIVKIDIADPDRYRIAGRGGLNVPSSDHGQVTPIGNLIFVGNDHGSGSGFIVHQKEPDTKGPEVNMISPAPQSVNQAITSRIGMTFTDNIKLESVNQQTFIVRPVGGSALSGKYSHQFATVNFSSDETLQANTTYEIVVPKDGLTDWMGNATEFDVISYFSTGSAIDSKPSTPLRFFGIGSDKEIKLFWDEVPGTAEYVVLRADTINADFTQVKSVNSNSWTDTDLISDKLYHYKVYASNSKGNSSNSQVLSVLASSFVEVPPAPKDLVGLGGIKGLVQLSWLELADAQEFNIFRSNNQDNGFEKIGTTDELSYSDLTVIEGHTYYYKISGVNKGKEGIRSTYPCKVDVGYYDYLSDLEWNEIDNGWGGVEADRSNGEQGDNDGGKMIINGVFYSKGLGVHARSQVDIELGKGYLLFLSDIGLDDEVGTSGSVTFEVWVDGSLKYESGSINGSSDAISISVDVSDAQSLSLIVNDGGNGNGSDHADWANARLVPVEDNEDNSDSDRDGIADTIEGTGDLDGDGMPNYLDTDSDGDGIPDSTEGNVDSDNDRKPDYLDFDSDGDNILDEVETIFDADSDNIPNYLDTDSDGDGIPDLIEGDVDSDEDEIANYLDLDSDGDTMPDSFEGTDDVDLDFIPNYLDLDSDGDGIADSDEGALDNDGDGLLNFIDFDSDGDGISDAMEGLGDLDGDNVPNFLDGDSDGDTIADMQEGVDDRDQDGIPNYQDLDSDGDNISDRTEGNGDKDFDGIPNYLDLDSDNDGMADSAEGQGDEDGDGIPNYLDNFSNITLATANLEAAIDIYPNPTTHHIHVSGIEAYNGKMSFSLWDIAGKQIVSYQEFNIGQGIAVSEFAPGIYIIKLTGDGVSVERKLIIDK
ncbi:MAG: NPCBM/NEW2 domain-containing protein [Cyclobacteriaceae bacterium]